MKEDIEIERKFMLKVNPFKLDYDEVWEIHQCYLPEKEDGFTVRYRAAANEGEAHYYKTMKKRISEMSCIEKEEEVSMSDYDTAETQSDKSLIKVRYKKKIGELTWEIDYFLTCSLVMAEVELPSEDYEFEIPQEILDCLIMEVTGMDEFYNQSLAITDKVAATQILK